MLNMIEKVDTSVSKLVREIKEKTRPNMREFAIQFTSAYVGMLLDGVVLIPGIWGFKTVDDVVEYTKDKARREFLPFSDEELESVYGDFDSFADQLVSSTLRYFTDNPIVMDPSIE